MVISRCIDFDSCRYNGGIIKATLREQLEPHVDFVPICPELEIGLGVPRDPVRLVGGKDRPPRMIQPASGRDLTAQMNTWSEGWLTKLGPVDGFILKAKSPSCGVGNTKLFDACNADVPPIRGSGLFAAQVQSAYGDAAIEDEGRLNNLRIREHFLTKLFALSAFRRAAGDGKTSALVDFQARNKLLLMAYNQTRMRKLGRIVADPVADHEEMVDHYRTELAAALARPPRPASNINVLMHALGYFSKRLSSDEKAHFLDALDDYRAGRVPVGAAQAVIASWIARFGSDYLANQSYFAPYPPELVRLEAPRKGRDRDLFA